MDKEGHLLLLAHACLMEMSIDENYGYGLQQDGKRPFGNSGHQALIDTLEVVGIKPLLNAIYEEQDMGIEQIEYARELWQELPDFIKNRCELVLK